MAHESTRPSLAHASFPTAMVVFSGFLLLAAIVLLLPGHASAQTSPPANGDWVITDQTALSSQTVQINGNVIVESGGSLSLTSVSLRIGSTYPGEFAIVIKNGGNFTVSGGSILAVTAANTYRFEIFGWASLDNVQPVRDMWGSRSQDKFGIQIYNGNVSITNSTVTAGERGNILVSANGGHPLIANNFVTSARYVEQNNQTFCGGAYVLFNAIGIMVINNSAPTIQYNQIRDNGAVGSFADPWQQYYDQYYSQCSSGYYYLYEFVLGYGIFVSSGSPEITQNYVGLNSAVPGGSSSRIYNGTYVYTYRYAEDWRTNDVGAGIRLSGGGRGNVSDNWIDRNAGGGVYGDGSLAHFEHNLISNHTAGPGVAVGGGLVASNLTFRSNQVGISLVGTGTGIFERIDFGTSLNGIAIYADSGSSGVLNIYNSTLVGFNSSQAVTFQSYQGATISLYNVTVDQSQISATWGVGQINVFWSLVMTVQWPNGAPASAAFAILTNQSDGVLYADRVDDNGRSPYVWIAGIRKILSWSGSTDETSNSDLSVRVYANGTISDPFDFHFNRSMSINLTITDPIPPSLNVFFPIDGQGFTTGHIRATGNAFDVGSGMDRVSASSDGGATWFNSTEPLPGWGIDFDLTDGTFDLVVRATDQSGTFTEITVTGIRIDTVAPHIVILQPSLPTSGPLISYTTFTAVVLRGTVADDTRLTLNGDNLSVQGGTFSKQLILNEGPNYFALKGVDGVGNSDEITFILVSDITKPALFVSSPADLFSTNRSVITVAGVTETDVALTLNDRTIRTTGGVFSEPYSLSEGTNTLRIVALDRAGNNNTITRTVFFDTVAPDITLTSPTPNMLTAVSDLTVAGSVENAILTVYVNGAPVPTVHGVFSKFVRLDEGRNVIVVTAWDLAGNPATASAVVTLDSTPPDLTLTAPAEGALVNTPTVTVRGAFANATAITVNGVALEDLTGDFEATVALVEGQNEIVVVVTDLAGNHATARVHVNRDSQPPLLIVDLPQTPQHTMENVVTVTGRTEGATELRANGELIATGPDGRFSVTVTLGIGENRLTFTAVDLAGNEVTVLSAVVRDQVPAVAQGLFGLGDLQYVLLPLVLIAGVGSTVLVLRRPRKGADD